MENLFEYICNTDKISDNIAKCDMKFYDLTCVWPIIGISCETIDRNFFQDLHTVDLEEFRHGGTNITAFRLVDPEKPEIQKVIQDWIYGEKRYNRELDMGQNSNKVRHTSSRSGEVERKRYNGK